MRYFSVLVVCILLAMPFVKAQTDAFDKNADIRMYFRFEKYHEVLSLINSSRKYAQDTENMLLAAISYYHLNELEKSEVLLRELLDKQKNPFPEAWLFLGKIYHHKHQFSEASDYYRQYLRNIGNNLFERSYTWNLIRMCANGLQLQYRESSVFVENLGSEINTEADEFAPKPSPNFGAKLYFSSVRPGNMGGAKNQYGIADQVLGFNKSDMFSASNKNGVWTEVTPLHYLLNSPNHDILLGFDKVGQKMYYFQGPSMADGTFMENIFQSGTNNSYNSFAISVPLDISNGDGTPHFVNDNLVIFSSNRDGGYGGYDLYRMEKKAGVWQEPVNLGSKINTPADERSPFMCRDGITLYFASNDSEKSIGGLDIFKSTFIEKLQEWTPPQNLGMPINSAGDEDHYYIGDDGFSAFFSSSRKDSYGQRDIYIAYFPDFLPEMEYPSMPTVSTSVPSQDNVIPAPTAVKPIVPADDVLKIDDSSTSAQPVTETPTTPEIPFSWQISGLYSLPEKDLAYWQVKMLTHPDVRLLISLEFPYSATEKKLADFISLAERISEGFAQAGITQDRLHFRVIPKTIPQAWNSGSIARIELSFYNDNPGSDLPEEFSKGQQNYAPAPLNYPFMYKVQIASAKSAGILDIMAKYLDPYTTIEKNPAGFLRLTVGAFNNYEDARRYRSEIINKGIKDAYIVPFIFKVRAEKKTIELFSQQFPDFLHYLNAF